MDKLKDLKKEIAELPAGWVSSKKIRDNIYYYHCMTVKDENGKSRKHEKYISPQEAEILRKEIEKRKELERQLRFTEADKVEEPLFATNILAGNILKAQVEQVKRLRKREIFAQLEEYVYGGTADKVLILYGLRRTGKTTMMRQLIAEMDDDTFERTAFIQISDHDTLATINKDLRRLQAAGYRYIFFDEVTMMKDFIEGAALFSDIYVAAGMKIVLSGTDSLGFMLSQSDQLYDRCVMVHTTFIPYREFESVMGIKGIDEYIRYGGTMSISGTEYNRRSLFADRKSVNDYVDTAIARNIQHSLRYYEDGGHFRHLLGLYRNNELTNAINRVVEDINHQFTKEVLTREFVSNDLALSARNLRNDRSEPTSILDEVDTKEVTQRIMKILDILDEKEQKVKVDQVHADEIKEYLQMLDLVHVMEKRSIPHTNDPDMMTIIAQPGIRFAQATALAESLMNDDIFNELSAVQRKGILERIISEIKGRMMEEIVLLETKMAYPDKEVFKLQFAAGEFDMVVFDHEDLTCAIYEVKHSDKAVPEQYRHLVDEKKCQHTEFRYGTIIGKYVVYRGEDTETDGITYLNVEGYLRNLKKKA